MDKISASVLLKGLAPEGFADEAAIDLVTTDSREVRPGCIFVAFPGEKFDGHDFAAKALEEGAEYVVLNHPVKAMDGAKVRYSVEAAQAKLIAARTASDVTRRCLQLFGGYGYTRDYPIERMMRDAKITEIYEGTSEVQMMVISGALLK